MLLHAARLRMRKLRGDGARLGEQPQLALRFGAGSVGRSHSGKRAEGWRALSAVETRAQSPCHLLARGAAAAPIHVIIPALDERDAIGAVVASARRMAIASVTVVDNGSSDDTAEVARRAGARVVAEPERGYGAACLAGLRALTTHVGTGADDIIVFLDGDGSDSADELPALVLPILEGKADLVVGARRPSETGALAPAQRVGNVIAAGWLRLRFGLRASDLGPFRAIRRSSLERLGMSHRGYGWTVEMQIKAARAGLRYREVRVPYRRRQGGRSKISGTIRGSIGAGLTIIGLLVRHGLRPG